MPGLCVRHSVCQPVAPVGPREPSYQLLPKSSPVYGLRVSRCAWASSVQARPGPLKRLAAAAPGAVTGTASAPEPGLRRGQARKHRAKGKAWKLLALGNEDTSVQSV